MQSVSLPNLSPLLKKLSLLNSKMVKIPMVKNSGVAGACLPTKILAVKPNPAIMPWNYLTAWVMKESASLATALGLEALPPKVLTVAIKLLSATTTKLGPTPKLSPSLFKA